MMNEMKSNYLLIFTTILLMETCVVETLGFLETSSIPAGLNSKDGQLNQIRQKRASGSYALEYIVVVEINVSDVILIQQLKPLSLELDNTTKISSVNITTVCQLNNTGYQCRCEDQYFWPCDKCMQYGQCDSASESSCYCITGVPNDGQYCQPLSNTSANTCPTPAPLTETTKYMSLTINEKFDIALTNQNSETYNRSKTTIEKAINKSYGNMAGYVTGSVRILRFRPGSIIVDFMIKTTTKVLDFKVANSELSQILNANGFTVNENSFAFSEEYNLTQYAGKIYPLQDVLLNCTLLTSETGTIRWQANGVDPFLNPLKYTILNNNHTLIVKSVSAADSGTYQCVTETNSLRNIQWQRIVIQPFPNIQVDPSKVYKCDNLSIPLQCCAQSSYQIEWTKDLFPLTPPGQGSGCIKYNYIIWKHECEAQDKTITFTCRLSNTNLRGFNYSSASISINITQREFTCADSSFGVGAVNQTAFRQCDGAEIGILWAVCNKTGQWSIISNNCTLRVIQSLIDMAENLNAQEVPMFAANLSNAATTNAQNITTVPVNLLKVIDLLSTIANISKTQSVTVDKSTMEDFLKTVDVITSETAQVTWNSFNNGNTNKMAISVLLQSIQSIGSSLSNDSFSIKTSNIQLMRNLSDSVHEMFNENSTTQISIAETNKPFLVTVIVFSALNSMLPVRTAAHKDSSKTQSSVNADMVVIEGESTIDNVSLFYRVRNTSLGNPQCVFWNFDLLDGFGAWDSTGCEITSQSNQTEKLTCECNHTTSFSLLMSPYTPSNAMTLAYITYIGVGISIGSLVLCLVIEGLIWKSMSKNDTSYLRHISTINIALSLLIADICFIIGASIGKEGQETPVGPCSTVTFFIHFFYLALFFWMLLSALFLLYRIVIVFSRLSRTMMMTIAFTVSYGAPLLIAVITVAVTAGNGGYIQEENTCWLNWYKTKAILAFVIPALAIVFINLLVLIIIVYKILRSEIGATIQRDEKHALVIIARCVGILTPLFGLTWGFGIGTMVSPDFGIHVVFAVLNSLQGFFILVFGTLLDHKIFGMLVGRWRKTISSTHSGNTVGGTSSANRRGYYHVFPRRYRYNFSTAAYSSNAPSSSTEIFKFTDK